MPSLKAGAPTSTPSATAGPRAIRAPETDGHEGVGPEVLGDQHLDDGRRAGQVQLVLGVDARALDGDERASGLAERALDEDARRLPRLVRSSCS